MHSWTRTISAHAGHSQDYFNLDQRSINPGLPPHRPVRSHPSVPAVSFRLVIAGPPLRWCEYFARARRRFVGGRRLQRAHRRRRFLAGLVLLATYVWYKCMRACVQTCKSKPHQIKRNAAQHRRIHTHTTAQSQSRIVKHAQRTTKIASTVEQHTTATATTECATMWGRVCRCCSATLARTHTHIQFPT